jgi:hypothetical protein
MSDDHDNPDMPPPHEAACSASPWRFLEAIYGMNHVVLDAEGRVVCAQVTENDGRLIAAAPTMLAILQRVAEIEGEDTRIGRLARRAIARALK